VKTWLGAGSGEAPTGFSDSRNNGGAAGFVLEAIDIAVALPPAGLAVEEGHFLRKRFSKVALSRCPHSCENWWNAGPDFARLVPSSTDFFPAAQLGGGGALNLRDCPLP